MTPVPDADPSPESGLVVRRRVVPPAVLGLTAAVVATGYLWRLLHGATVLDALFFLVTGTVAALYLRSTLDARTPLLLFDDVGVRVREATAWQGLRWQLLDTIVIEPPRHALAEGRLTVIDRHRVAVFDVRLGLLTSARAEGDLVAVLRQLAADRCAVVQRAPRDVEGERAEVDSPPRIESRGRQALQPPQPVPARALPLRDVRHGRRVELTRGLTQGATALELAKAHMRLPEADALTRPELVEVDNVWPMGEIGALVPSLVIDEFETAPAFDPVIGPQLAAARHWVGLTVEELSDRTRIRPHIIEAIEVDDFAPCGGDVYARGHLRALARLLGREPEQLVGLFDDRYAASPITARRVFEAELATGAPRGVRSAVGGASWSLLVGLVLLLVLVWGILRLVAGGGDALDNPPLLPPDGTGSVYAP